jgi:ENTH domain
LVLPQAAVYGAWQLTTTCSDQQRSMGSDRNRYERNSCSDIQQVSKHHCRGLSIMLIHLPSSPSDFYEIMDMLDKRLNDKGKNWRHVLKSLKVLDYCLHEGSELVVTWARKNIYIIKTLREFQYIDEEGRDVGQNGRLALRSVRRNTADG